MARRYVVERIALDGLRHAAEQEVLRRLSIAPGDQLDEERVTVSRLRLLQLGWFSKVETRVERGSERGLVVLVFSFAERNTLLVTDLIVGSTAPAPFYGGFGLTQQNFLGRGLGLSGAFVYGSPHRAAARATFFAPDLDLGPYRLVLGLTGLWLRGEELACAAADCAPYRSDLSRAPRLRYDRWGGEVTLGFRPGPFHRFLFGWRLEHVGAQALSGDPAIDGGGVLPPVRAGDSLLSAITATYDRDTRNDVFFPTEGSRFAASVTFSSRVLGSDYEHSRYLVTGETDFGLPRGHALRLQGALGAVQGDAPFFDRFYAADWAYFSIGPALGRALEINFSTSSRYDAVLAMGGLEWGIPLWSSGGFFDRGYLALGARALFTAPRPGAGRTRASEVPVSAEAALRLDTPVGSFNLSLGYLVDVVW